MDLNDDDLLVLAHPLRNFVRHDERAALEIYALSFARAPTGGIPADISCVTLDFYSHLAALSGNVTRSCRAP